MMTEKPEEIIEKLRCQLEVAERKAEVLSNITKKRQNTDRRR